MKRLNNFILGMVCVCIYTIGFIKTISFIENPLYLFLILFGGVGYGYIFAQPIDKKTGEKKWIEKS